MANPTILEESQLTLADANEAIKSIEKRDIELGFLSQKTKEYLDSFKNISLKDKKQLEKSLIELDLTRLKKEHIVKIIDFLPTTEDELKTVLQAYPLTLPKKDKTAILEEVKKIA